MIKRTPLEYIVQQVEYGVKVAVKKLMVDGVKYTAKCYRPGLGRQPTENIIRIDLAKQGEG